MWTLKVIALETVATIPVDLRSVKAGTSQDIHHYNSIKIYTQQFQFWNFIKTYTRSHSFRNAMCGKLQCENVQSSVIFGIKPSIIQTPIAGTTCWGVDFLLGSDVPDPGMVNEGTKCEAKKVTEKRNIQHTKFLLKLCTQIGKICLLYYLATYMYVHIFSGILWVLKKVLISPYAI